MSMIIPVAGEGVDSGQKGHACLPCMHQPIRKRESELLFCATSLPTASLSVLHPHYRESWRRSLVLYSLLLLLPALFVHWAASSVGSDQEVFISVTNKRETEQKNRRETRKGRKEREAKAFRMTAQQWLYSDASVQTKFKDEAEMMSLC